MLSSVDLPEPDGPITATYSPASMETSIARSACTSLSPSWKMRSTATSSICAPGIARSLRRRCRLDHHHGAGLDTRPLERGDDAFADADALEDLRVLPVRQTRLDLALLELAVRAHDQHPAAFQ